MKGLTGSIGRYRILGHWASGLSSEVYAVRNDLLADGQSVFALKIMAESELAARLTARTTADVRATIELSHPEIARTYDAFVYERRPCIVSHLIPGEPLAKVLTGDDEPPSPRLLLGVVADLATALHAAHQHRDSAGARFIHGDVCPDNVQVTYEGQLVLLNHGLALREARLKPERRLLSGHVGYYAPERALGAWVDERSDVYSLGIMLWELLAKEPALAPGSNAEVLRRAAQPRIAPIRTKVDVPESLASIIERAIAPARSDRFTSTIELAAELERLLTGRGRTVNTRAELLRLMAKRFSHRAQAMRTLIERWSPRPRAPSSSRVPAAPFPESPLARVHSSRDEHAPPRHLLPRPASSSPVPRPGTPAVAAQAPARATTPAKVPSLVPVPPPSFTPGVRALSEEGLHIEAPVEWGRTDDLALRSTGDLPSGPRHLPFLSGLLLSLGGALIFTFSAALWPPEVQRFALRFAAAMAQAVTAFLEAFSR